jgi:hypothetical protein
MGKGGIHGAGRGRSRRRRRGNGGNPYCCMGLVCVGLLVAGPVIMLSGLSFLGDATSDSRGQVPIPGMALRC